MVENEPLSKSRIQTLQFLRPTLPYSEAKSNLNLMVYDTNGQLYGKLKRGRYLVVLSYMESMSKSTFSLNQYSPKTLLDAVVDRTTVDFRLRFVAPDITIRKIYAPDAKIQ